ncbi:heavy metal translocating P-type ATPase [Taibaiella soli]|uniref:Heavy metal translocating P-type ATPase n=1 Tax=Taibaiella soli TaxID=1649169 RepID=A0A2W2A7X2_9BACT|nr:heavy metal translocating P-type ATPase metal-binding domain-containing protein [Taibaiella soli]PZF71455.1 heavy metal translocating P-type ATPase [Taibaiella soli]
MPSTDVILNTTTAGETVICYHCGTACLNRNIATDEKFFCCEGCLLVYEILNKNGLCDYYKLQNHPGLSQIKAGRQDKYAFLDEASVAAQLYSFTDGNHTVVNLYIPGVHCSSCMWLLEHLQKINPGITDSRLNFTSKELTVRFNLEKISLRSVVELLATIGYPPYISLDNTQDKKPKGNSARIYKLGIAGFCFGNIMMMSFPEYFSLTSGMEKQYTELFRYLNLGLALPVFFYCASEFWINAWKGLQQKMLNIDAPIALAILITFTRSIYEIATHTGSGFLDSMSGIIFFMLVGRVIQERVYSSISFHRDYKAYFPIAVSVLTETGTAIRNIQELKENDVVQLHHDEIIPADGMIVKGEARIDYSFVTGESDPVIKEKGDTVYAGGRQTGTELTICITKPVASSYLTSLWNHHSFQKNKHTKNNKESAVHVLSKYFTYVLFALALITGIFWAFRDPSKILPSVSAMLIVACPCALLLSATYTNGNLLRLFSNNGLFLRDADVIEPLGKIDNIVFDKTGTLTECNDKTALTGAVFSAEELASIFTVANSSQHPYSRALVRFLGKYPLQRVTSWQEYTGKGIEATVNGSRIKIGSASFLGIAPTPDHANVYISVDEKKIAAFRFYAGLRTGVPDMLRQLRNKFRLSLLSGDNEREKELVQSLFDSGGQLLFNRKPIDKLHYIASLQEKDANVLMIGDGLNDAGALQQSNVGITLADDINNFTPSCDAILSAGSFTSLPAILNLARNGRAIIRFSFFISVIYNVIGLSFAVQGKLNPLLAAILMPVSTLSIVLITTGLTYFAARLNGLGKQSKPEVN